MKKALVAGLFLMLAGHSQAAANASEALAEQAQIVSEANHAQSVALTEIFQKAGGFMAGANAFSPPAARKKWGFNIGLMGGYTGTPIDRGLVRRNLKATYQPVVEGAINGLPDPLPIPQTGINAHLGLPPFFVFESFDVGLRYSAFNVSSDKNDINLADLGLDLRGNVFQQGPGVPFNIMVGLSVDSFNAGLYNRDKGPAVSYISGFKATGGTITAGTDETMDNKALGLKIVASRKLKFFTPYLGVSAQINSGQSTHKGYYRGSMTMTNTSNGADTASGKMQVEAPGASTPIDAIEIRAAMGAELDFKYAYLQLNTEYGTVSEGFGANIQIGGKFR